MILGTHNSCTFLKVKQWWLKPFLWIAKCQSLNLQEQYDLGVRYFDIRVRIPKNYHDFRDATIAHGLIDYKGMTVERALFKISMFDEPCVVRLFLENHKKERNSEDSIFLKFIKEVVDHYSELKFVEGGSRYRYEVRLPLVNKVMCYAQYWTKKFCIPFPKLWAYRHNTQLRKNEYPEGDYCVFDYIQYK